LLKRTPLSCWSVTRMPVKHCWEVQSNAGKGLSRSQRVGSCCAFSMALRPFSASPQTSKIPPDPKPFRSQNFRWLLLARNRGIPSHKITNFWAFRSREGGRNSATICCLNLVLNIFPDIMSYAPKLRVTLVPQRRPLESATPLGSRSKLK
jgi:hypothetical protein